MEVFQQSVAWTGSIPPPRKISCIVSAAIALAVAGYVPRVGGPYGYSTSGTSAWAAATEARNLLRANISQAGRRLIFSLRTSKPVALTQLRPLPRAGEGDSLCLELRATRSGGERRLCLGGKDGRRRLGLETLGPGGEVTGKKTIASRLKRPEPQKLVVTLLPAGAGLSPQRYRWRVAERLGPCHTEASTSCEESLPGQGARAFRLRPVRAVGCTGGSAGLVTNGPRERRLVALTFDDGPSEYTPGFLDALRRERVPGTFFELGQEMPGREATMRRIMREGDEIGDHTMHHTEFPGYGDIAPTADRIAATTHFRPCLFRPPGGGVDSSVIAAAAEAGMKTVNWDVDPVDWSTPGTGAIYSRIVDTAQPGSIILMHDGGGNRSETLAALPRVIDTLRSRGFGFETVTRLLGDHMIYRPYG
jgi:peptidoglycan/xylan/chitin deacetylase (PgdA/CDA1 family)